MICCPEFVHTFDMYRLIWINSVQLLDDWSTSRNNGFYVKQVESAKMAARIEQRDENIAKLLNDKNSINTKTTKTASKGSELIFKAYLQLRKIQNPATAEELVAVFRKIYTKLRTHLNPFCVLELWKYFEWIIKQLLNSAFLWYEELCRSSRSA